MKPVITWRLVYETIGNTKYFIIRAVIPGYPGVNNRRYYLLFFQMFSFDNKGISLCGKIPW